ncbi:T9SS type A sorting domain-containing protein [Flavobacterium sp.]|uniref:T9SS type A sorting domain-containing protein n=1 Tax=Flavobacterium sp. TaxID=239 RepID=UPI002B4AEF3D|nr:T9SS type A sorting domain-containing protein [Flavobacterium sp.]HLF53163.1 T9SS type A sorting domain-containing protein [Flavobacterium sp.]
MKKYFPLFALIFIFQNCFPQYTLNAFYPTNNASGTGFGTNVAINNNEILVSSASMVPMNLTGKVYLFNLAVGGLQQTDVFYPSDAVLTDDFGSSISIQNDFIAIGSPLHDANSVDSGAVYLYKKVNNAWVFLQKITAFDANLNDHFGSFVKIHNNHLFISATGDEPVGQANNANNGSVYVYTFNGTEWIFSTNITAANSLKFGEKIEAENNKIVISCRGLNESTNFIFNSYNWNNTNWVFESSCNTFGSLEEIVKDFSLSNNQLFLATSQFATNDKILVLSNVTGNWTLTNNINISLFPDQVFSRIEVNNDKMFIGSTGYILQMQRKFPLLYYKNIGGNWTYQNTLYGNGAPGEDDFFGSSIATNGNVVVVGAPREGLLSYGKAYYVDVTLSNNQFEKESTVLYPNPSQNTVFIKNNSDNTIEKAEVYSITGNLLFTQDKNLEQLSLEKLAKGVYFINLSFTNGSKKTYKIIRN